MAKRSKRKRKPKAAPAPPAPDASDAVRQAKKDAFLRVYARTGNLTAGAQAAEVHRDTIYEWRREDPVFRKATRNADKEALDRLILAARIRGEQGVDEPVIYQGKVQMTADQNGVLRPVTRRVYSDALLMFLIRLKLGLLDPKAGDGGRQDEKPGVAEDGGELHAGSADLLVIDVVDGEQRRALPEPAAPASTGG